MYNRLKEQLLSYYSTS